MTARELKALLEQIPEDRLDQPVYVIAGVENDKEDFSKPVAQVQAGTEDLPDDKDEFQDHWNLYAQTMRDLLGIELSFADRVLIVRD